MRELSIPGAGKREGNAGTPWLAGLLQRSVSALVLIPLVIALVFFGGWVAFGGAVLALLLGAYELHAMFIHRGWHPPSLFGVALGLAFLAAARLYVLSSQPGPVLLIVGASISALLIATFAWLILTRKNLEASVLDWALSLGGAFYLGWPLAFFLLLRGDAIGSGTSGFWWMLALFFIVWSNDTFAFFTGHYLGRTKLAPTVSPAKTWEGFAGGLVFAVAAALIFAVALPSAFGHPLHVAWYQAVILGALVAVVATIGDLAESLLKRGTGVKDSGKLVPGHGGILDRMDSLLFAVMVVFFFALAVGDLPFVVR
jgi:phosphatidate cytidylyltransferase